MASRKPSTVQSEVREVPEESSEQEQESTRFVKDSVLGKTANCEEGLGKISVGYFAQAPGSRALLSECTIARRTAIKCFVLNFLSSPRNGIFN